jgi:hypothetical protein
MEEEEEEAKCKTTEKQTGTRTWASNVSATDNSMAYRPVAKR